MEPDFTLPKVSKLISETWKIYSERWSTFLILVLPYLGWQIIFSPLLVEHHLSYLSVCVIFIIGVFTQLAVIGNLVGDGSASRVWYNFPKYIKTVILMCAIVSTGFLLLIVPGLIWLVWFSFYPVIVVEEGVGGMYPLLKSREYMRGQSMKIFGKLCAFTLITAIPSVILSILGKHYPMMLLINSIYSVLLIPLVTTYSYNLYQHVKSARPALNPIGPNTGFKIAAWVGPIVMVGLLLLGILFYKVYLPKLELQAEQAKNLEQ